MTERTNVDGHGQKARRNGQTHGCEGQYVCGIVVVRLHSCLSLTDWRLCQSVVQPRPPNDQEIQFVRTAVLGINRCGAPLKPDTCNKENRRRFMDAME